MSLNPDHDEIVSRGQPTTGTVAEARAPLTIAAPSAVLPVFEGASAFDAPAPPPAPPWGVQSAASPAQPPARAGKPRGWIVTASVAIVGIAASGTLGYFLYTTAGQRDAARHQLASKQATLAGTDKQLAARKVTDVYLGTYMLNSGRVMTEYENTIACDSYVSCRTAAQDLVTAMKSFQTARSSVAVPSALANADSQLGDALSAAIAGDQEFINGMDTDDVAKVKEGGKKVDAAMLRFAKAESALAASLN